MGQNFFEKTTLTLFFYSGIRPLMHLSRDVKPVGSFFGKSEAVYLLILVSMHSGGSGTNPSSCLLTDILS